MKGSRVRTVQFLWQERGRLPASDERDDLPRHVRRAIEAYEDAQATVDALIEQLEITEEDDAD